MKKIVIAVLLSIFGPGMGQIYNREYWRGGILIALSLGLFLSGLIFVSSQVSSYLPMNAENLDIEEVKNIIGTIQSEHPWKFRMANLTSIVIWVYSVVDAYLGAKKRNVNIRREA